MSQWKSQSAFCSWEIATIEKPEGEEDIPSAKVLKVWGGAELGVGQPRILPERVRFWTSSMCLPTLTSKSTEKQADTWDTGIEKRTTVCVNLHCKNRIRTISWHLFSLERNFCIPDQILGSPKAKSCSEEKKKKKPEIPKIFLSSKKKKKKKFFFF